MKIQEQPPIAGLILAGGQSRRMGGGDKPLLEVGGETLLDRVIGRLHPQARPIMLSINGDPARFAQTTLPILPDVIPGHAGPLAGILSGLEWLEDHGSGVEWMVSAAADTPLFPEDLVARLWAGLAARGADMAVAESGGRDHPVFALWPCRLAAELRRAVAGEGLRKLGLWLERHRVARVAWPDTPHDPFFNVNTPEDLERLHALLG